MSLIAFQSKDNQAVSIPVEIASPTVLLKAPPNMTIHDSYHYLLDVQKNLLTEEKEAYKQASQNSHLLSKVYNASLFNLSMSRILEKSLIPFYEFILHKQQMDQILLEQLQRENELLELQLASKQRSNT